MKKLTPPEVCFQTLDRLGTPQHIAALGIIKGQLDISDIQNQLEKLTPDFPRLKKIFQGYTDPYEVFDPTFNPINSLEVNNCPGDLKALLNHSSKIMMAPFNHHNEITPLWKIHLVKSTECIHSIIIFKLHHSFGDGISGLSFFHSLFNENYVSRKEKLSRPRAKSEKRIPLVPSISKLFHEAIKPLPPLPIHGENSNERTYLLYTIPNKEIRQKKKTNSCTSFAVLLSIISKLMNSYTRVISESKGTKSIKAKYFRALVPVSIRGKTIPNDFGNEIGGTSIYLPLNYVDEKSLILEINNSLKQSLKSSSYGAYYLTAKLFASLPRTIRKFFCNIAAHKISGICTFLQAPRHDLSIGNSLLTAHYAMPALMPGQGVAFGFIKHQDKMHISIILDPKIILKPEILDSCMKNILSDDFGMEHGTALASSD